MSDSTAAFILFGGFSAVRYPEFRESLRRRDLRMLVVDHADKWAEVEEFATAHGVTDYLLTRPGSVHEILEGVRHWAGVYELRGLFNTVEDFVTPAAVVADLLDLPGPGLRAAMVSRDKYLQRAYFPELSPAYTRFEAGAPLAGFSSFPAVLKPVDRHGGSGIKYVESMSDVRAQVGDYAPGEMLVLEEFVTGVDINVEALVWRGEVVFENITEEVEGNTGHRFLEMGYTMPATRIQPEVADTVYRMNRHIATRVGFQYGMMHAEYKITATGAVILVEFAARTPGDGVLPLYQLSTGRSLEDEIINTALGHKPSYPKPSRPARQVWFEHPPGDLVDVVVPGFATSPVFFPEVLTRPRLDATARGSSGSERTGLREVLVEWRRGDRIPPLREGKDRCGSFLIEADDMAALDTLEDRVRQALRVVTK